ncbi:MAG: phage major capsid protein [Ammonifex sp.]|jgi:HK97 family phage major capsid protein|nr:MAG: phage major capsid protein [Ammonifex sp.]
MNESQQYKALLQERAELISDGKTLFEAAERENRELSEAEKARDDEINARLEAIAAEIQRHEQRRERERTAQALPRQQIGQMRERSEDDPRRGFRDVADFALAVRDLYTPGGARDERLFIGAAPTDYHYETGSGEGRMVPPAFRQEIWEVALEEDALLVETDNEPTGSNAVEFLRDESTPWGSTGVQARWRAEASQMTPSKLVTEAEQMRLHDLYAFVTATEQLLADAPRLRSRLTRKAGQAIRFKINQAIVEGTGAGQPLGYMNAGSLVSVAKETSQVADTIVAANVAKMYARILGASRAIWYINQDALPQLLTMTLSDQPIWTPPATGFVNAPGGLLLGRPVRFSEHASTVGDQGDIQLVNLRQGYYAITSDGGVQFASSMHLYFDYGLEAFRWTFRMNGQPYLSAAVSPNKGSSTRSHAVVLDARA